MAPRLLHGLVAAAALAACAAETVNYKSKAIELDQAGDHEGALAAFRQHTEVEPLDPTGWANLGVALMRVGTRTGQRGPLADSLEAFEKAVALGGGSDPHTQENIAALKTNMKIMFPDMECPAGVCGVDDGAEDGADDYGDDFEDDYAADADGLSLEDAEVRARRIRGFACDEETLTFYVSPKDRRMGVLTPLKVEAMLEAFEQCGVVVLEGAYDGSTVDALLRAQSEALDEYLAGVAEDASRENTTRAERRSPGRYELKAPLQEPFTDPNFLQAPFALPFIEQALGSKRVEVDTLSSVTALEGAPAQHWHRDASGLFDYDFMPVHQPPHGVVVFVPLSDVPEEMGPTEFLTTSHRSCREDERAELALGGWVLEECPWVQDVFRAKAQKGAAVFFDLRVLHRGGENRSAKRRALMYVSYVREFWVDRVNFNDKQTSAFDDLPPGMKKLLSRQDSREYTAMLERKLEQLGVDVAPLQSSYDYAKHSFGG